MELLALLPLVSVVSARCNNVLPLDCGQTPDNNKNGPYAIFNTGNYNSKQNYVTSNSGRSRSSTCLSVDVIPITLREIYNNQPFYTRIVENTAQYRLRDNTCTTFFPVTDDEKSFLIYVSIVYSNGLNDVTSFLITEVAPGVMTIANAEYTLSNRIFASIGDNLLLSCTRTEFGDSDFPEKIVLSHGPFHTLGSSCLQQIQQIFDCNGLSEYEDMYELPNRLPLKCYTQQTCLVTNPFIPPILSGIF